MMRKFAGILALLALFAAVNLLVWERALFSPLVAVPFAAALVLGAAWLILTLFAAVRQGKVDGRALGGVQAVLASLLFLGICMVLYALVRAWGASWDLTAEGRRDLSPQTIRVLQSMTREVTAYCIFLDTDDELVLIAREKTLRFLKQCQEYTELLKIEEVDPQIDRARLEAMELSFVSKQGTVVLKAGTSQKVIALSGGSPRLEERDFTNALVNVLRTTKPMVCFLSGHQERDINDENPETGGSLFATLLDREAYGVGQLDIKITAPAVPAECDILVINNPKQDLHPEELRVIQEFMDRGGRLLVLLEPWRTVVHGQSGREALRPWLEETWGITVGADIFVAPDHEMAYTAELSGDASPYENVDEGFMDFTGAFYKEHPITQSFNQQMILDGARTVSPAANIPEGVGVTPLLRTPPDTYAESDVGLLGQTGKREQSAGEPSGPLYLAVAASKQALDTGSEEAAATSRIVVVGDSDLASNSYLTVGGNFNFLFNAIAWLSQSEELIAIRPTGQADPALVLTPNQQRAIVWISTLMTVQLVALAGLAVYLVRRKNQ